MRKGFQKDVIGHQRKYTVDDHDLRFFFGDMNFRINLPNHDVRRLCQNNEIRKMYSADQLFMASSNAIEPFCSYQEPYLNFLPTYKYDKNTSIYDTSKKARAPAWCDRIMYKGDSIHCDFYNRTEYTYSDHRPISAEFTVTIKEIDANRRNAVQR